MIRYSVIEEKNPREIVMLRGRGCDWRRCTFCDYHLDFSKNDEENFGLNRSVLANVTGVYGDLEVINSGSFVDLDDDSIQAVIDTCVEHEINTVHFECHYMHRDDIPALRERFGKAGIKLKLKIGLESFDYDFREKVLVKGIDEKDPAEIARDFEEVNLLMGITGQTGESMIKDIEMGLEYFERVCVNVMTPNTAKLQPDYGVIEVFRNVVLPRYQENERVDILMVNTDFGVGGEDNA